MRRRDFLKLGAGALATWGTLASCSNLTGECEEGCESLYPYYIHPTLCTGCSFCVPLCGKSSIGIPSSGRRAYVIDSERCIGCGNCYLVCPYDAVRQVPAPAGSPHPYLYEIIEKNCVNCGECHTRCHLPPDQGGPGAEAIFIRNDGNRARIDQTTCSHCAECVELEFCPNDAIFERDHPPE